MNTEIKIPGLVGPMPDFILDEKHGMLVLGRLAVAGPHEAVQVTVAIVKLNKSGVPRQLLFGVFLEN